MMIQTMDLRVLIPMGAEASPEEIRSVAFDGATRVAANRGAILDGDSLRHVGDCDSADPDIGFISDWKADALFGDAS